MTVLQALESVAGPASLTQLATSSGMRPSKIHRYLVSLSRVGLISQSPTSGHYDFGPAMRRLGVEALRRIDEVGIAADFLPGLRDRTRHAVNLAVWGDRGPVLVRWAYGAFALPITVRVGATLPLLTSSIGRVYLTHLPAALTAPIIEENSARLSVEEIQDITDTVRRNGVAVTSGAVIPGVTSVAAPVFTTGESLPLAISVALPAQNASPDVMREVTEDLLVTSAAMSAEIGHQSAAATDDVARRPRRNAG